MVIPIANIRGIEPGQKNYLLTHGCIIEHGTMLVPFPCPHLIFSNEDDIVNGKPVSKCDIHETKPQTCKDFDGRPISHGRKYFVPDDCTMSKVRK